MGKNNKLNIKGQPVVTIRCQNKRCPQPEVQEPLELFDGELACPYCGELLKGATFKVNAYNDELFRFSQVSYLTYLMEFCNKGATKTTGEDKLDTAVSYCREASRFGHPEARVKLGYYWEMGYMKKRSGIDCYKMAYRYYVDVLRMNPAEVEIDNDDSLVEYQNAKKKLAEIKKEAAMRLAKMLSSVKVSVVLDDTLKKELEENNARIIKNNNENENDAREDAIYRQLESCNVKSKHSPVFGYFILTVEDLQDMYKRNGQSLQTILRGNRKLELKWIKKSAIHDMDVSNDHFYNLTDSESTLPQLDREDGEYTKETLVLLYFFNGKSEVNAGRNALLKKSIKGVRKSLFKKGMRDIEPTGAFLNFLVSTEDIAKQSCFYQRVFFNDDVRFAWLRNKRTPIEALSEYFGEKRGF